jgi:predicted Zn-dependent peptidase
MTIQTPSRSFCAAMLAGCLLAPAAFAADAGGIVAHPDQLTYRPFTYTPPKAADHRVKLGSGAVAYLVSDHATPLVTITVIMRMGGQLDPAGKEGLASATANQLTKSGTATMTAEQVEARVAALGATLDSGNGGGFGGGFFGGGVPLSSSESRASVTVLSKDLDEGLGLLTACLKAPAFQADRLKLWKDQQLQAMKGRNDESGSIEEREWAVLQNGAEHWSNHFTTKASIEGLTADDLRACQKRYVGPRNFVLAVSGDFDRAEMTKKLEKALAGWPSAGEHPPAPPAPAAGSSRAGWFMVDKDVNQGRVSIGLPTIDRYDPDYAAARIMNDILGGGGFTSWLVNRIRSDEGLAYSVNSSLPGGVYYPASWRLVYQSKVRSVAYATQLAFEQIRRMRDSLVTAEELQASREKFVQSLPVQFETAGAIAGVLAADEATGRYEKDPSYYADYGKRLSAVTVADVQRVARRLLDPAKMSVLMVGNAKDMLLGDPKHEASIPKLAGASPVMLPLRDPFTMKAAESAATK